MVIITFGVSGAGKTTVGELLARELGWHFYEADDFHSLANVEKMWGGIALKDEDRWPWFDCLRELIKRCLHAGENAVLACCALKRAYRERYEGRSARADAPPRLSTVCSRQALFLSLT